LTEEVLFFVLFIKSFFLFSVIFTTLIEPATRLKSSRKKERLFRITYLHEDGGYLSGAFMSEFKMQPICEVSP
jgi:hypothetical protein